MFKRKKGSPEQNRKIAPLNWIATYIRWLQLQTVSWLHRKTLHWKQREQKRLLFLLCLFMGGCSTHSLLQFLSPRSSADPPFSKQQPLPELIYSSRDLPMQYGLNDTAIFLSFRRHIDSLNITPEGRKLVEQFTRQRPGFMDSLLQVESLLKYSFTHQ